MTTLSVLLQILAGLLATGGTAAVLSFITRPVVLAWAEVVFRLRHERVKLDEARARLARARLQYHPRNEQGLLGAVTYLDENGVPGVVDLDLMVRVLADGKVPQGGGGQLARLRLALAAVPQAGAGAVEGVRELLAAEALQAINWPSVVTPEMVVGGEPISINRVPFGITMDAEGKQFVVRERMANLVHLLVAGRTRMGKSVFLEWLAWCFCRAVEELELALVDIGGNVFDGFRDAARLRYPIAEDKDQAVAVFAALEEEMRRRRALFQAYAGERVANLDKYNALAGRDGREVLRPVVTIIDEGAYMFRESGMQDTLLDLIQQAGKVGVWLIVAGQDFNYDTVPTRARGNFVTRMAFNMDANLARNLVGADVDDLRGHRGRMRVLFPGEEAVDVQVPLLEDRHFIDLPRGGPIHGMPPVPDEIVLEPRRSEDWRSEENAERVAGILRRQVEVGGEINVTAACREVFGVSGGVKWAWCKSLAVGMEGREGER